MTFGDAIVPVLDRCFRTGGILSYHAVVEGASPPSPDMHVSSLTLRRQLEYAWEHYRVLPLHELLSRHQARRSTDRCVAITFDAAYVGVLRHAAPILRDLDLPATVFVSTRPARRGDT